jgi:hypothetical protein
MPLFFDEHEPFGMQSVDVSDLLLKLLRGLLGIRAPHVEFRLGVVDRLRKLLDAHSGCLQRLFQIRTLGGEDRRAILGLRRELQQFLAAVTTDSERLPGGQSIGLQPLCLLLPIVQLLLLLRERLFEFRDAGRVRMPSG